MTERRCVVCERSDTDLQGIQNEETGERVTVCWECLRSRLRAKADASDDRARRLLARDAQRFDWNVWSTEDVLYLLPPFEAETGRTEETDAEPVAGVTHG